MEQQQFIVTLYLPEAILRRAGVVPKGTKIPRASERDSEPFDVNTDWHGALVFYDYTEGFKLRVDANPKALERALAAIRELIAGSGCGWTLKAHGRDFPRVSATQRMLAPDATGLLKLNGFQPAPFPLYGCWELMR